MTSIEEIKRYIDPKYLLKELGGNDNFNFDEIMEKDPNSDAIFAPRLWTHNRATDYYPPPVMTTVRRPSTHRVSNFARSTRREDNLMDKMDVFDEV